MSIYSTNYRETHFEYPDLTKIVGCPTYDTLHLLKNEIKANAISVHSNLGGRQHGHLGLAISPESYACVSNVPYTLPLHPGDLVIVATATNRPHDQRACRIPLRVP